MIIILIESIITTLLIGAALILSLWVKSFKTPKEKLIRKISIGIVIIGLYELSNVIYSLLNLQITAYSYNKAIKLLGLLVIMFSLFKYMEEKKI